MTLLINYENLPPALSNPPLPPSELELALIDGLERGRLALPVLPESASAAIDLANQTNASVPQFTYLIQKDPTIAARFISTANSAYYSRGQTITRLDQAILRVGLMGSRDLLFQIVYGNSTQGLKRFKQQITESFQRSVISAVVARIVSGELKLDYREAYLCGLLHDIGEARVYRILDKVRLSKPATAEEIEEVVQRYHARAGAEIAREWRLPDEIIEVCELHHQPHAAHRVHVRLVQVADLLTQAVCRARAQLPPELDTDALARLEVSAEASARLYELALKAAATL